MAKSVCYQLHVTTTDRIFTICLDKEDNTKLWRLSGSRYRSQKFYHYNTGAFCWISSLGRGLFPLWSRRCSRVKGSNFHPM